MILGYSNGAALGLDYALDALDDPTLPRPDRLIMLSPAVGITGFAAVAGLPRALRFVPLADDLRWNSIVPEIDPFKYSSFPANAGYQTHKLTVANRKRVARLAADGRGAEMPPILAFVSLADATVNMESIAADLMMPLANPHNEMVVFDVNRQADIVALFGFDPATRLAWLAEQAPVPWTFTAVTNEGPRSRAVIEKRWHGGAEEPTIRALGLEWPEAVYSLSHVALPFPPDDPLYGATDDPDRTWGLPLGSLEPRGETGLLRLSIETVMRLRYNPFYDYLERRTIDFAAERGQVSFLTSARPGELPM
jgi:alpha-beta hydrolase superfamily lysophospholipase